MLGMAGDAKESRRQWKTVDPDSNGFAEVGVVWAHIRELFPELFIPAVLKHCLRRVVRARTVSEQSMVVKNIFRLYVSSASSPFSFSPFF